MGLIKQLEFRDSIFTPYLNCISLFDVQTGTYVPGAHNGMILNGGLGATNGVIGREQMFKSTELFSFVLSAMHHYPESECMVNDTEYAQKKDRLLRFLPDEVDRNEFEKRIAISTPADTTTEEFFAKAKDACLLKVKHAADYTVETPILDPRSGKPLRMLIPTFMVFDTWSKMMSDYVQTTLNTKELGSSDTNMVFMKDGIIKKMMMAQIPRLAAMSNTYFLMSAHVGNKFELNPYAQTPKSLPNMRQTDKPREVGSDFNFLISNVMDVRRVQLLQDDKKESQYPSPDGGDAELNEVLSVLVRCKNNMSGTQLPLVLSQFNGVIENLSNYHYLKENKYFGMPGSTISHKPAMTDVSVGRTTIRQKLADQKVARAVELLAQLCYIQNNWNLSNNEVNFMMNPEDLAKNLITRNDKPGISDILESRGWWTYDKKNQQPYMSLYDVLAIAQGVYRAKGISLTGLKI